LRDLHVGYFLVDNRAPEFQRVVQIRWAFTGGLKNRDSPESRQSCRLACLIEEGERDPREPVALVRANRMQAPEPSHSCLDRAARRVTKRSSKAKPKRTTAPATRRARVSLLFIMLITGRGEPSAAGPMDPTALYLRSGTVALRSGG
jgi:hypothetical protein